MPTAYYEEKGKAALLDHLRSRATLDELPRRYVAISTAATDPREYIECLGRQSVLTEAERRKILPPLLKDVSMLEENMDAHETLFTSGIRRKLTPLVLLLKVAALKADLESYRGPDGSNFNSGILVDYRIKGKADALDRYRINRPEDIRMLDELNKMWKSSSKVSGVEAPKAPTGTIAKSQYYKNEGQSIILKKLRALAEHCDLPTFVHQYVVTQKDPRRIIHLLGNNPDLSNDYDRIAKPVMNALGDIEQYANNATCLELKSAILEVKFAELLQAMNGVYVQNYRKYNRLDANNQASTIRKSKSGEEARQAIIALEHKYEQIRDADRAPSPFKPSPITRTIKAEDISSVHAGSKGVTVIVKLPEMVRPELKHKAQQKDYTGNWLVLNQPSNFLSSVKPAQPGKAGTRKA